MQYFWRAFLLAKNQWGRRILAGIGVIVDSAGLIIMPLIIRNIFDSFTAGQDPETIINVINTGVIWLVILGIIRAIFVYIEIYYQEGIGNYISHDIRKMMFKKILFLPFSFFDRHKTGNLMSILTRDVDAVRDGTGFVIMLMIVNVLTVIGITVAMLMLHPILTLIVLIPLPLLGLIGVWYSKQIGPLYQKLQRQSGKIHTVAQENISGIRVVKAFTREKGEQEKFATQNDKYFKSSLKIGFLSSYVNPSLDFLGGLTSLIALGAGGFFVIRGEITLGTMIAFTNFVDSLIWPIRQSGWLLEMMQRAIAGAKRIYGVIDQKAELKTSTNSVQGKIQGNIKFEDVQFAYPNGETALRNFSLQVNANETICLLGVTGSGKTTVVNLLARFYDPLQGRITIDGIDIRNWDLQDLRSQIGFVFQDNFLFSSSLRDNITMGKPTDPKLVEDAIKAAQAEGFIKQLPQGLDSLVGERGIGLSGGERQRVAIARAILESPPILIFDDSSASLDMKTEAKLQQELKQLYDDRTVLIIAQRVSTAKFADKIIVLDNGEIVEQGTHQELLAHQGIYAQLNQIQTDNLNMITGGE